MSVLEFLGAILPWPASKRPEDIQICKSRLILQANGIHRAVGTDPWERMLAHACDRGAAEWEHWLLTNHDEPPEDRERTAHSALTLAQRSQARFHESSANKSSLVIAAACPASPSAASASARFFSCSARMPSSTVSLATRR